MVFSHFVKLLSTGDAPEAICRVLNCRDFFFLCVSCRVPWQIGHKWVNVEIKGFASGEQEGCLSGVDQDDLTGAISAKNEQSEHGPNPVE
jgi:hypothetical protein